MAGPAAANGDGPGPRDPETGGCGTREQMLGFLAERYGEIPVGEGYSARLRMLLIVAANPRTGTWTALVESPYGLTCLVDAGEGWRAAVPGEGA